MCGTFCHFAEPSCGNNVAPFVLSVFESEFAGILLVAPATFVVYTNKRANERSTAYSCSKESPAKYEVEFCSTTALVSLVSIEGQNPYQLFATVETSETIECVKSSMFMLVFCMLLKTC